MATKSKAQPAAASVVSTAPVAKRAESSFGNFFDLLVLVGISCYGFLLIIVALATAFANPGKAVLAILVMLGITSQVAGNPVSDAFKVAMAKFRERRTPSAA